MKSPKGFLAKCPSYLHLCHPGDAAEFVCKANSLSSGKASGTNSRLEKLATVAPSTREPAAIGTLSSRPAQPTSASSRTARDAEKLRRKATKKKKKPKTNKQTTPHKTKLYKTRLPAYLNIALTQTLGASSTKTTQQQKKALVISQPSPWSNPVSKGWREGGGASILLNYAFQTRESPRIFPWGT